MPPSASSPPSTERPLSPLSQAGSRSPFARLSRTRLLVSAAANRGQVLAVARAGARHCQCVNGRSTPRLHAVVSVDGASRLSLPTAARGCVARLAAVGQASVAAIHVAGAAQRLPVHVHAAALVD